MDTNPWPGSLHTCAHGGGKQGDVKCTACQRRLLLTKEQNHCQQRGCAVVHRVAGPRHLGGRESWVQQLITPLPPLPAPARLRPPSTRLLFSLHSQQPFCGILYSNHTSSQTQRHLPTSVPLLQPCPQPGTPGSFPAQPNPAPPWSSAPRPHWVRLSPSRGKSNLLSLYSAGADGMLPRRSVRCPPVYLPSLPLKACVS